MRDARAGVQPRLTAPWQLLAAALLLFTTDARAEPLTAPPVATAPQDLDTAAPQRQRRTAGAIANEPDESPLQSLDTPPRPHAVTGGRVPTGVGIERRERVGPVPAAPLRIAAAPSGKGVAEAPSAPRRTNDGMLVAAGVTAGATVVSIAVGIALLVESERQGDLLARDWIARECRTGLPSDHPDHEFCGRLYHHVDEINAMADGGIAGLVIGAAGIVTGICFFIAYDAGRFEGVRLEGVGPTLVGGAQGVGAAFSF